MSEARIINPSLISNSFRLNAADQVSAVTLNGREYPFVGQGGDTKSDFIYYPQFDTDTGELKYTLSTTAEHHDDLGPWLISGAQGPQGPQGVSGNSLKFEDLTPAQKTELTGPQGVSGDSAGFGTLSANVTSIASDQLPNVTVDEDGPNTAKNITFNFSIPSGVSGANGTSPNVTISSITAIATGKTGNRVTIEYGDDLQSTTSFDIWNGDDGAVGNISAENGLSARKDGTTTYVGLSADTMNIVGSGTVTLYENDEGQLVIHGTGGGGGEDTHSDWIYYPSFDEENGDITYTLGTTAAHPAPLGPWHISGATGKAGADGKSITSVVGPAIVTAGQNIIVSAYSDNELISTFEIPAGAIGEQGVSGNTPVITVDADGYWTVDGVSTEVQAQGPQGVSGNSLTFEDLTEEQKAELTGPQGVSGDSAGFGTITTNVTTLDSTQQATATFTPVDDSPNSAKNFTFNLSVPSGKAGEDGKSITHVQGPAEVTAGQNITVTAYSDTTVVGTFDIPAGASGLSGENGLSPTIETDAITGEGKTGTKITFKYGDDIAAEYSAWNGKDGDAGTLPKAPDDNGNYILNKTDDNVSWSSIDTTEFATTGQLTALTTSAEQLSAAIDDVLNIETLSSKFVGSGSVIISADSDKIIISGAETGGDLPENVMLSADEMSTGQWIWDNGKFIEGPSYYANYKTYVNDPDATIEVPLSGIYFALHNNNTSTNYNYIKTYAYNNSHSLTTGFAYTLPNHWSQMFSADGNNITVKPITVNSKAIWQLSAKDFTETFTAVSANTTYFTGNGTSASPLGINTALLNSLVTSSTTTITGTAQYALTTAGWSAVTGGGTEFTGIEANTAYFTGNGTTDSALSLSDDVTAKLSKVPDATPFELSAGNYIKITPDTTRNIVTIAVDSNIDTFTGITANTSYFTGNGKDDVLSVNTAWSNSLATSAGVTGTSNLWALTTTGWTAFTAGGEKGDPGFSPTVTITDITGVTPSGVNVEFTYQNDQGVIDKTAYSLYAGEKGEKGFSPTVATTPITAEDNTKTGTEITFTYLDEKCATVTTAYSAWNGKDGEGAPPSFTATDTTEWDGTANTFSYIKMKIENLDEHDAWESDNTLHFVLQQS